MKLKKIFKISLQSICKNKMRSGLTSLGIIIGVCSVIVMVAIGQGSQEKIEKQINSLGTNLLMVFPARTNRGGANQARGSFNKMKLTDCQALLKYGSKFKYVSGEVRVNGQIIGGSGNWNSSIEGVSEQFLDIKEWELAKGEFFTSKDIQYKKKVAVLGHTVAEELFGDDSPLGERIRINNTPFTVIGVLAEKGETGVGNDQDDIVIAPVTTVLSRLKGGNKINMIFISAIDKESLDEAQIEAEQIMRIAHKLDDGEDSDFQISTQSQITEMASQTSKTLTLLLGAIAGVSLMVGGIGIMNIMLVSVTERTREIGIRLSIGARSSDVLFQFLAESVTLSLFGGLVGILLAMLISGCIGWFTSLSTSIHPLVVLISFAFSGTIGIFFGYYPAKKAANLNPIDALRYE